MSDSLLSQLPFQWEPHMSGFVGWCFTPVRFPTKKMDMEG
jgi:hypothetical protein